MILSLVTALFWCTLIRVIYVLKVIIVQDREIVLTETFSYFYYDLTQHRYKERCVAGPSQDLLLLFPVIGDMLLTCMLPVFIFQLLSQIMLKYFRQHKKLKSERQKLIEKANYDPDILKAIEEVNKALKKSK